MYDWAEICKEIKTISSKMLCDFIYDHLLGSQSYMRLENL